MNASMCADRAGISYRQFDHWCRRGYIPDVASKGSGNERELTRDQFAYVMKLAKLVKAGVNVHAAAEALKKLDADVTTFALTSEVSVTVT